MVILTIGHNEGYIKGQWIESSLDMVIIVDLAT